ncbi:MAG: hypothetical protein ACI4YB_12075 [Oscillospiraceae bacterium]
MAENFIRFAVRGSNDLFKLELCKTLLHFTEFDFTYFWERCMDAGRAAKKSGHLPSSTVSNAKTVISAAHPYIEAMIGGDYSEIVTDCIIEYICHSERISLDELWVRCISPKSKYEEAIFNRISMFKSGKASNGWTNIVRLQEYAQNKLAFIYDTNEDRTPDSPQTLKVRKEYFDVSYSVAANELGMVGKNLPSVAVCNPGLTPTAAFMNAKVAKAVYRRFSEAFKLGGDMSVPEGKNCEYLKDKLAMDAYDFVRGMKRPGEIDMKFALEAMVDNPDEVYLPDSFKAIIDLEFDLIMKNGLVFRRCEECGKFFAADDDSFLCNRINSSGMTCRQQADALLKAIAEASETLKASEKAEEPVETVPEQPKKPEQIPPELEKRGQKIYNALYKRVGKAMDEKEFHEWSRYLSDMKKNIKAGEATSEQLCEFLDYSDKLCAEVKKGRMTAQTQFRYPEDVTSSEKVSPQENTPKAEESAKSELNKPEPLPEVIKADAGSVRIIKPFRPETFDSLADAFMAGRFGDDGEEETAPKPEPEVKEYTWTRMTREEAYGLKDPQKDGESE